MSRNLFNAVVAVGVVAGGAGTADAAEMFGSGVVAADTGHGFVASVGGAADLAPVVLEGVGFAALPPTGRVDSFAGVSLYGQCVPNARALGVKLLNRTLPFLNQGVAADLWKAATPGFAKRDRVRNNQVQMPPIYSFVVWSRQLGGTGHIALVVGHVDGPRRIVRLVDTNWRLDGRGEIHDVTVNDARILGYLVAQ